MALPTPKELKALAAACRSAGITKLKQGDLELEFSAQPPAKRTRKASQPKAEAQEQVQSDGWDSLTEEEKLCWSAAPTGVSLEGVS